MAKQHHLFLTEIIHRKLVWFKFSDSINKEKLYEEFYDKYGQELESSTLRNYFLISISKFKKIGLKEKSGILTYSTSKTMNYKEFFKQLKQEYKSSTILYRPKLHNLQVMQINLISKKEFQRIFESLVSNNYMYFNPQIDAYMITR